MANRFLILLLLFSCGALGQTITGRIHDESGHLIPNTNVLLLATKDSSLVQGSITDGSGRYIFYNIRPGRYLLAASNTGYKTTYSTIVATAAGKDVVNIPPLILLAEPKQLKEVTVTAKRPFVEQRIDRTVVNVANSIIASGSTALEVLEKAPGVIVDRQNDQISLRGKEGVIVQIDGKQTFLPIADVVTLLKNMSSDNIDRIELITNPSAKYDAAGNAGIIDIRVKKNNNVGTNGAVSLTGGAGRFLRKRGNLQVNHRTAKVNLSGNYNAYRDGGYYDFNITRQQPDGAGKNIINSVSYIRAFNRGQNVKAGADYFINKSTTIGVIWTAFWNTVGEHSPAHAIFRRQEEGPVYLHTLSDKTISTHSSNHLGNFNLQHLFSKRQAQLSADVDAARFRRDYTNALNTETLIPYAPGAQVTGLYNYMPTSIDILTFKSDYSQAVNANWKMEAGVKSSSVHSDNNVVLENGEDGTLQVDTSLSNHFKYKEQVNAAYLNFTGKLNARNNVMLGLRAEHTHSVGNSLTLNHVVDRSYLNLFPSFFLSHIVNKKKHAYLLLQLSYRPPELPGSESRTFVP